MRCRVCRADVAELDSSNRCRCCRIAKAATDQGTSYGKLMAQIGSGSDVDSGILKCPRCGKLFLPKTKTQIYDCNQCAVLEAKRKYRKRQRAQAVRASAGNRKEPSCKSSKSKQQAV